MKINFNFKNFFLTIISIIVAILVMIALYSNREQFLKPIVIQDKQETIEEVMDNVTTLISFRTASKENQ